MTAIVDGSLGFTAPIGAIYNGLQQATVQNSTSGTSITFTNIPSWVKRVTVMLSAVQTSGTSQQQIRLGTSGGIVSSGYASAVSQIPGNTASAVTTGFPLSITTGSSDSKSGLYIISNLSGNVWSLAGGNSITSGYTFQTFGTVNLGALLTQVQITTANGTDTFTAGSINILYE